MRAIVMTLAVAALLLSGCGGDDGTTTDSSAPTATTQTTTEEQTTAAAADAAEELEGCLRKAGAKLASSPADLRFAAGSAIRGDVRTDISAERGNLRVFSLQPSDGDWRIYVAAPRRAGGAPGIQDLLSDPGAAVVTAYVNPADQATIREADACMTG